MHKLNNVGVGLILLFPFLVLAGHFLLTQLLLENIKKTARKSRKEGRIVNVSSEAHWFSYCEGIRFDKINDASG
jgi:WW domain-containing oxidoreductase